MFKLYFIKMQKFALLNYIFILLNGLLLSVHNV